MRSRLILISLCAAILSVTATGAENDDGVAIKKRQKKFPEKNEMKRRGSEDDDDYGHKRFNKYKDLSEEEDDKESDEYDEKMKFRWNKNFKNHKYNNYEKYDGDRASFGDKPKAKEDSPKPNKKRIDIGEVARKYSKSKNDRPVKKTSDEDVSDSNVMKNRKGPKPKLEVRDGRRSKNDEKDTSSEDAETSKGSSEDDDESREFDSDLQCDSSEDSCDI